MSAPCFKETELIVVSMDVEERDQREMSNISDEK